LTPILSRTLSTHLTWQRNSAHSIAKICDWYRDKNWTLLLHLHFTLEICVNYQNWSTPLTKYLFC
jgi:hypothetical protein